MTGGADKGRPSRPLHVHAGAACASWTPPATSCTIALCDLVPGGTTSEFDNITAMCTLRGMAPPRWPLRRMRRPSGGPEHLYDADLNHDDAGHCEQPLPDGGDIVPEFHTHGVQEARIQGDGIVPSKHSPLRSPPLCRSRRGAAPNTYDVYLVGADPLGCGGTQVRVWSETSP